MAATEATAPPENVLPGFGLPRRSGFDHDGFVAWDRLPDGTPRFPFLLDSSGMVEGWLIQGLTLREVRMMAFVNDITDKPDWQRKVFDEAIVAKWRAEAKVDEGGWPAPEKGEAGEKEGEKGGENNDGNGEEGEKREDKDVYMSAAMFDYCIAQLRDKAKTFADTGMVSVLDAELAVVKSDTAVPAAVRDELRRCVAVLEDVPENQQDWHPGSHHQVLDLVHPSLYPVVFGRTRVLPRGTVPLDDCISYTGKGVVAAVDQEELDSHFLTHDPNGGVDRIKVHALDKFQWLPAEVTLRRASADATTGPVTASITSYINNLHPHLHRPLYAVLEQCVAAAVPLWETCLSSFTDRRAIKLTNTDDEEDYYLPEGVRYPYIPRPAPAGASDKDDADENDADEDDTPKYGYHGDGNGDADSTGEPGSDEDDDYKYDDRYDDWWVEHRILRWPEPAPYPPWGAPGTAPPPGPMGNICLTDKAAFPDGVQVIFKLANIHLTPEQPAYDGGAWHIEGTLAERICASALYYYDEDNITESTLHFRAAVDHENLIMVPAQNAFASLEAFMGINTDQTAEQDLGAVRTRPGRLLVFPNVLQHRVAPFRLRDPARPGHRKLLALFLVEPRRRILSSAVVPPQRRDWWAAQVARDVPSLGRLPPELYDQTVAAVDDFPIDWATALQDRLELMDARRTRDTELKGALLRNTFNFCEH